MLYGYTRLHMHIQNESRVKLREQGITERGEMGRLVRGEERICLRYYNCMKTFNVN